MARTQTTTMKMCKFNRKLLINELQGLGLLCEEITDTVTDYIDRVKYLDHEDDDLAEVDTLNRLDALYALSIKYDDAFSNLIALSHKPEGK